MPAFISMLRAVNLGPHNRINMDDLRALHEKLGYTNVATLLQSGNVVFRAKNADPARLAKAISDELSKAHGLDVGVVVRTGAQLRSVIERNPFPAAARKDPSHLVVIFLSGRPAAGAAKRIAQLDTGAERLRLDGELYVHYTAGIGRSKLTNALIEKALGVFGTGRNWNTVTKLLELADATV